MKLVKGTLINKSGGHDELMRARGYYYSLVERQIHGLTRSKGEQAEKSLCVEAAYSLNSLSILG